MQSYTCKCNFHWLKGGHKMNNSLMIKKQEEEGSYNRKAANWWSEKIQSNNREPVEGLESFRNELSFMIKKINSIQGSMIISTYNSSSRLLNQVALNVKLNTSYIPTGYEMRILFNKVNVYNKYGIVVASF